MDCTRVRDEGIAEGYVAGRLAEPEADAFEAHLLTCPACHGEVARLCALREELERSRARVEADAAAEARLWRRPWVLAVAAGILAAGVGLGVWVSVRPTAVEGPTLAELAHLEAPPYAPMRVRGGEDDAERRFEEAMELYVAGDWRGALPGLRAAAALDPEAPHVGFYLGACALLAGETDEGVAALERVIALGDTLFLEEARFELARARVRAGDLDRARDELRAVVALDGGRRQEAQALLPRLDAAGGLSR